MQQGRRCIKIDILGVKEQGETEAGRCRRRPAERDRRLPVERGEIGGCRRSEARQGRRRPAKHGESGRRRRRLPERGEAGRDRRRMAEQEAGEQEAGQSAERQRRDCFFPSYRADLSRGLRVE